jgi:hypothetical protein
MGTRGSHLPRVERSVTSLLASTLMDMNADATREFLSDRDLEPFRVRTPPVDLVAVGKHPPVFENAGPEPGASASFTQVDQLHPPTDLLRKSCLECHSRRGIAAVEHHCEVDVTIGAGTPSGGRPVKHREANRGTLAPTSAARSSITVMPTEYPV